MARKQVSERLKKKAGVSTVTVRKSDGMIVVSAVHRPDISEKKGTGFPPSRALRIPPPRPNPFKGTGADILKSIEGLRIPPIDGKLEAAVLGRRELKR